MRGWLSSPCTFKGNGMSDVSICNLALSHLGDTGIVTAISPPDGSVQAARCAVFYPHVRSVVLEARDWSFAMLRTTVADLNDPTGSWLYRYALPSDCVRISKVLPEGVGDSEPSEPFVKEILADGAVTLLTDVENATVLYVRSITDTTKFSAMFTDCFGWLLASYLAGPIIKGKAGTAFGEYCLKRYATMLSAAATSDSAQHKPKKDYVPPGISARG